jgi:hypothetical protein
MCDFYQLQTISILIEWYAINKSSNRRDYDLKKTLKEIREILYISNRDLRRLERGYNRYTIPKKLVFYDDICQILYQLR